MYESRRAQSSCAMPLSQAAPWPRQVFDACINNLATHGRMIIIGAMSGYQDASAWSAVSSGPRPARAPSLPLSLSPSLQPEPAALGALPARRRGASREGVEADEHQAPGQVSVFARLLSQSFCTRMAPPHEAPPSGPHAPLPLSPSPPLFLSPSLPLLLSPALPSFPPSLPPSLPPMAGRMRFNTQRERGLCSYRGE